MNLILATRNRHKLDELLALLDVPGLHLIAAADVPGAPEVEEDGVTFEANAIKKAVALARHAHAWAMADDSGLEVDALGGAPGVYSARYAGAHADHAANNAKLLSELADAPDRRARFRCVIALASPDGEARCVEGRVEGRMAEALSGIGGFGYDPLFVPEGFTRSFAEMPAAEKNAISHRGRAVAAARAAWSALLAGEPAVWPA